MYLIIMISYARKGFCPLKQTWKNTASLIELLLFVISI